MKKVSKSRERLQATRKKLANLTEQEKQSLLKSGTLVTVDGKRLSDINTMFILLQNRGATVVGGFKQWRQSGRQVIKGSSGFSIWVPIQNKEDEAGEPFFIVGTVFDVSQTEPITELIEA